MFRNALHFRATTDRTPPAGRAGWLSLAAAWLLAAGAFSSVQAQTVTTIAGGGVGDNTTGANANLLPGSIAFAPDGSLFIAGGDRIRKIGLDGIIRTFAGGAPVDTGIIVGAEPVIVGDGGPATAVRIAPGGLAIDTAGNVFFIDNYTKRIRKVTPAGIISTVAGTGQWGFSGDGGPGTAAMLNFPARLAFDGAGNLYISDALNFRVRKLAPDGIISTIAGNGINDFTGDGGPAVNAATGQPLGLATDLAGNVYFFAAEDLRVRKVSTSGVITTIAGRGDAGYIGENGEPALSASFRVSYDLVVDAGGSVYVADSLNHVIRRISPSGQIYRYAGSAAQSGFFGDGGPATAFVAKLNSPGSMAYGPNGSLYFSDGGNFRIRTVSTGGILNSVYGNGSNTYNGDGGAATDGILGAPKGNAVDAQGNVFFADVIRNRVRKVSPAGIISTVAGNGQEGFSGDGGLATNAKLRFPSAVAVDAVGNLYITDEGNGRVRKVATDGRISTFAGTGDSGFSGDGGPATAAMLNSPGAIAVDSAGYVYIADTINSRVRRVAPNGTISTVAGKSRPPGDNPYDGVGGPASNAYIGNPVALFIDSSNGLLIAADSRIYSVSPTGILSNVAGELYDFSNGSDTIVDVDAHRANVRMVTGLVRDSRGNIYVASNSMVRVISPGSVVIPFAGIFGAADYQDSYGFRGDGGPAIGAKFYGVAGLSIDAAGNIIVSDSNNGRIRRVTPLGAAPPPSIPGQVRAAVATANAGNVTVSFQSPIPIGGVNLPTYFVRSIPAGAVDLDGGTGKTEHRIGGLVPGQVYRFTVRASNPAGIGPESEETNTVVVLQANPTVSVQDASIAEGPSFLTIMRFAVRLSHASPDTVRVNLRSSDLTAISDGGSAQDYFTSVRELVFYAGETQAFFEVTVRGDGTVEPDETLAATITSVTGATVDRGQAVGTIVNDDGAIPALSIADTSVGEGNSGGTPMVFTVTLSAPAGPDGAAFEVTTLDNVPGARPAVAGNDYSPLLATKVRIEPGQSSTTFSVKITGDTQREGDETVIVSLGELRGATAGRVVGTGTIIDDDGGPGLQGGASTSDPATTAMTIAAVQGTSSRSPVVGHDVTVQGIVTALVRRGFYLQSSDLARDADPRSADAVLVATGKMPGGGIAVGNLMTVRGRVEEAATGASPSGATMTQLAYLDATVVSAGHSLPVPMPWLDRGTAAGAEALEGMRVAVPASRVVGPAQGGGIFHVVAQDASRPMGPATSGSGPTPLRVASAAQAGARAVAVDAGDRLPVLTGVLHQAGDLYELRLDPAGKRGVVAGALPRAAAAPTALAIAQLNLGGYLDATVPDTQALRLAKAANAICAFLHSPDVLIVNEIAETSTLSDLADAVNTQAGNVLFPGACADRPDYRAHLVPTRAADGSYAGLLIRANGRTSDASGIGLRSLSSLPVLAGNRSPAAASAFIARLLLPDAQPLTVIAYRDGRSDVADAGALRARQWAQFEAGIARRPSVDPAERFVVFADTGVPSLDTAVPGDPAQRLRAAERYDAVVDGRAVALSRVRLSPALVRAGYRATLDHARINADFGDDNADDYAVPLRISDRDPLLLLLDAGVVSPACTVPGAARCAGNAKSA